MMLWPGNKTSDYKVHKIVLCDCTHHIFKRTIADEVKSNAAYLLYGLKTCGKVITITETQINTIKKDHTNSTGKKYSKQMKRLKENISFSNLWWKL